MMKLNNTPSVKVICDLQFGSTGKGVIVGRVAQDWLPTALATGWGTNAGHTMITDVHGKRVATQVASAAVVESVTELFIGGGSLINPFKFADELDEVQSIREDLGYEPVQVTMVDTAALIMPQHEAAEQPLVSIGSTMKGNSAAIIQKLSRNPIGSNVIGMSKTNLHERTDVSILFMDEYISAMKSHKRVLLEGAQGFSLGINQGFYPYCTSRECTPQQLCTEAGVPASWVTDTIGCLRTFPIRVSNRFDVMTDRQIGWSGGHYPDQKEITFGEINQKQERTTVTNLPRRIFTFSQLQLYNSLVQCAPSTLFLNFCNYHKKSSDLITLIEQISETYQAAGYIKDPLKYLSFSGNSDEIMKFNGYDDTMILEIKKRLG